MQASRKPSFQFDEGQEIPSRLFRAMLFKRVFVEKTSHVRVSKTGTDPIFLHALRSNGKWGLSLFLKPGY
jgi:hypothetical protein